MLNATPLTAEAEATSPLAQSQEFDVFQEGYEGKPRGEFGTNAGDELHEDDTYESIVQRMLEGNDHVEHLQELVRLHEEAAILHHEMQKQHDVTIASYEALVAALKAQVEILSR